MLQTFSPASSYDVFGKFWSYFENFKKLRFVIFPLVDDSQRISSQQNFFSKFFVFSVFVTHDNSKRLGKDRIWVSKAFCDEKSAGECHFWQTLQKHVLEGASLTF